MNPRVGEIYETVNGKFEIVGNAEGTTQNRPGRKNWDWLIQWQGQIGYDELTHSELMEMIENG